MAPDGTETTPSPAALRAAKTILAHNLDRRKKSSREFVAKIIDRETRAERDRLADNLGRIVGSLRVVVRNGHRRIEWDVDGCGSVDDALLDLDAARAALKDLDR